MMLCPAARPPLAAWRAAWPAIWRRWSGPVALSVADQGLSSGAHFTVALALARRLQPAEYGVFALAYAVILLTSGVQTSLILEPMGVIGPARYAADLRSYVGSLIRLNLGLSSLTALLLLAAAAAFLPWGGQLPKAMAAAALAVPGLFVFWLFRRACYLAARPGLAVAGSSGYALFLCLGMLILARAGALSTASAFLLMAGAGLGVGIVFLPRLCVRWSGPGACEVRRSHWTYARWSLSTTALYWLASSIYTPMTAALAGLEATAALRAAENLLLPMSQVLTALGLLLLPRFSEQHRLRGRGYLRTAAVKTALLAATAASMYTVGVLLFGGKLIGLIYGADRYAESLSLVPFQGVAVVFRAIADTGLGIAVRAAGRPDIGFWTTAAAAVATLTVGLGLVSRGGAQGAAAGWMISSAASCAVSICLFRGWLR